MQHFTMHHNPQQQVNNQNELEYLKLQQQQQLNHQQQLQLSQQNQNQQHHQQQHHMPSEMAQFVNVPDQQSQAIRSQPVYQAQITPLQNPET